MPMPLPLPLPLPLSQPQSQLCDDNAWCTYQAIDLTSITVIECILFLAILIALFLLRNLYMLYRLRTEERNRHLFGPAFLMVYYLVLAWVVCVIAKTVINVVVYYRDISWSQSQAEVPTRGSPVVILSAISYAFDTSSTFFILSLTLFIPYEWFKFLLQHINDHSHIPLQSRLLYNKSFKLLKFLKIYMLARSLILIWCFTQAGLIVNTKFGCRIPNVDTAIIIGESVLILGVYLWIFYVAESTKRNRLVKMSGKDYRKIRTEYSLLMLALISRIILNLFFNLFASKFLTYTPGKNCSNTAQHRGDDLARSIFLALGYSVMHLLPVCIVLYIYKPDLQVREHDELILRYEGSENFSDGDNSGQTCVEDINRSKEDFVKIS